MRIRTKITLMGVLLPIISVVIVLSLIMTQRQNLSTKLRKTLDSQVNEELALLARDVYSLCRTDVSFCSQIFSPSLSSFRT
jgi:hypothetical protein